jgi:antirestriction protein ArdC
MDTYAIVTEKIINLQEQGIVPWRRPWNATGLPCNLVSKKPYRGVNLFLLSATKFVSPFWLTMKQANELGGSVRKGEHSQIVVFWKVDQIPNPDSERDSEEREADERGRRRFVLRNYRLFNLEQCELPQTVLDKLPKIETNQHDPIEAAEQIAGMPNPPYMENYVPRLPNYLNNLKNLGWAGAEFEKGCSDKLVDAIVAWGTEKRSRIASRRI